MAGICLYNFTVAFVPRHPDIMNDGKNKLTGSYGSNWDSFLSYKNER